MGQDHQWCRRLRSGRHLSPQPHDLALVRRNRRQCRAAAGSNGGPTGGACTIDDPGPWDSWFNYPLKGNSVEVPLRDTDIIRSS